MNDRVFDFVHGFLFGVNVTLGGFVTLLIVGFVIFYIQERNKR